MFCGYGRVLWYRENNTVLVSLILQYVFPTVSKILEKVVHTLCRELTDKIILIDY
jgi:hypothetical protein